MKNSKLGALKKFEAKTVVSVDLEKMEVVLSF